ncbi:hypothetical protein NKI45_31330, partial [Mesorhizobium sp. M0619]
AVDDIEVAATPKDKNIHAKLGRLNSLQRNINAYMNSKSKKFAGIQAYVTASAAAKSAQAAVDAAQAEVDALNAKLNDPNTPADQVPTQEQIDAAQAALDTANIAAADAAAAVPSLDDALADMANKPVDAKVTEWANGVLAEKIDEMAAKQTPAATP